MSVTVSSGSLLSFLADHVDRAPREPTTEPTGLCLVAGGIVGSNLDAALRRREIPPERLEISTIETVARTLLAAHHRRNGTTEPVAVCNPELCQQLLVERITTNAVRDDAVDELLAGFDWTGRPTLRETLWRELNRYFRMTAAGRDADAARKIARELAADDPYASRRSLRALDAFETLHETLAARTEPLAETTYLSRSHLVSAARSQLAAEWVECFPTVEWVTLDSVSVLDNPTLRFFEALAQVDDGPDIYVFGSASGAGPSLYDRLAATSLDPVRTEHSNDQPHVAALLNTVDGSPPASIPNTQFLSAPDARRELAAVATQIRTLTGMTDEAEATTTCGEIVVAAKDVIPYRNRIEAVFEAHGIPTHIQARRPLMQTVPYRYLTAVCALMAAAETDQPITPQALVDPLRLGFYPPADAESTDIEWPVSGQRVAEIERWVENLASQSGAEDGQSVSAWAETIRASTTEATWPAMFALVEWIESTAATTPDTAPAVVDQLVELLDAYSAPLVGESVRRHSGPGIDDTRTALTRTHTSRIVDRLRRAVDRLGSYLAGAVETGIASYCWQDVADAVHEVCGGASYWPTFVDGAAVRVVNAANAHYLDAEYVFVIGLGADEFPTTRSPPVLFHEAFYDAIQADSAAGQPSARGYLHAPTAANQFDADVEEYRAAISAADSGLWLCRQYTARTGEPVAWSGFVDAYTATADEAADDYHRIAVDEWLPTAHAERSTVQTATPRERLGLLCGTFSDGLSTALRPRQSTVGLSDRESITELLSAADGEAYRREIEPRRRRYAGSDIESITVQPDEPVSKLNADADGHLLSTAAETPIRTHELDLYATCQLKYYFYQYFDGGSQRRDEVSTDSGKRLPALLDERYPEPALTSGLRRLITSSDRLADRQTAFCQFDSLAAFRDQLAAWIDSDPALDESLMQPMLGEYQAVQREFDAGLTREWRWEPATTVRIGGHELSVPGHRVDTLADHGLSVPVWYTRQPGAAGRLVERSLAQTAPVTERDHRLLAGALVTEPFGGTLVYEPTSRAAIAPHGLVVGDLNPIPDCVVDATNLTSVSRSRWNDRSTLWTEHAETALAAMSEVDEPLTYCCSDSFVAAGGCAGCVYRELCGVPTSWREDQ